MAKDYWDLTNRPHTRLKLQMLEKYLHAWAKIIFNQAINKGIDSFREAYYVDCFSGRGKYHMDGQKDSVPGSPLRALECAVAMQDKYHGANLNCIFVDVNKTNHKKLVGFCESYRGKVNYEILPPGDFNGYVDNILTKISNRPSFFFIDPYGTQIKKESIIKIASKKGPNDILMNYTASGVERITGLIRKDIVSNEADASKRLKTIK